MLFIVAATAVKFVTRSLPSNDTIKREPTKSMVKVIKYVVLNYLIVKDK